MSLLDGTTGERENLSADSLHFLVCSSARSLATPSAIPSASLSLRFLLPAWFGATVACAAVALGDVGVTERLGSDRSMPDEASSSSLRASCSSSTASSSIIGASCSSCPSCSSCAASSTASLLVIVSAACCATGPERGGSQKKYSEPSSSMMPTASTAMAMAMPKN